MSLTLADIRQARKQIAGFAFRTPLVPLNVANAPARIYLKLENLQPIGSFKIRGAANALAQIAPQALARGVVTASAGNMAQGVAWCAREHGVPCTVIAPDTAPATKVQAIERLPAPILQGRNSVSAPSFPVRATSMKLRGRYTEFHPDINSSAAPRISPTSTPRVSAGSQLATCQ